MKPSTKQMQKKAMRKAMRGPRTFKPGVVYTNHRGQKFLCFPDGSMRSLDKIKAAQDAEAAKAQP
jgi:hypothetical protein